MSDQHPVFTNAQLELLYHLCNRADASTDAFVVRDLLGEALAARGVPKFVEVFGVAR